MASDPRSGRPLEGIADRRRDGEKPTSPLASEVVFRIRFDDKRSGARRSTVVYDAPLNIVWMCRTVRLSDFPQPQEPNAYKHLADLWVNDKLLPDEDERNAAIADIYWRSFIEALERAKDAAHAQPGSWVRAVADTPAGKLDVGHVYVEREDLGDGVFVTRFFIVTRRDPHNLGRPQGWIDLLFRALEQDDWEGATWATEIPPGQDVVPGEQIAVMQCRTE